MQKNEVKLMGSIGINKIGNVMYDYGNSTWIAGLGMIGSKYIGYYQLAENLISLFFNPIGGAVADRFKRRKILLTTDLLGAILCALLALIASKESMLYGLIAVNAILAMSHAFSGISFRSYVVTLVEEDRLVDFNAHLELLSQVIGVSSPLFAFLFVDRFGIKPTLVLDSLTFFVSFLILYSIRTPEKHLDQASKGSSLKAIFQDIRQGLDFVVHEKEIFFLLVIASLVNFFIAAFNYLLPFTNQLFGDKSSFATFLSMGTVGAIIGALIANKVFKNSYESILLSLALSGFGLFLISPLALIGLPTILVASGNLIFELFLTIFNIHFFTMVQKKVPNHLLGRVFSSIFTVAIVFMPLATTLMTTIPFTINQKSFGAIGLAIFILSVIAYQYSQKKLE